MNSYEDIINFKERTNSDSVMIARAAMWNCSILRPEGIIPLEQVVIILFESLEGESPGFLRAQNPKLS